MRNNTHHTVLLATLVLALWGYLCPAAIGQQLGQQSNQEIIGDIKNAYENLDFSVAEARVDAAIDAFDRFTPAELGEIYSISALIFFARDDQAGTRRQLDLALQVNPELKLSAREAPPQVIAILDELIQIRAASLPAETELRYLIVEDPRPAAVMRSMVLPGWGQLYKKQRKKGILLMSAWGLTSVGVLVAHNERKKAEAFYLASIDLQQINNRYPAFDRWHKARNSLFIAAAGVWAYSYVDALLDHPSPLSNNKKHPLQLSFTPIPKNPSLSLNYSF